MVESSILEREFVHAAQQRSLVFALCIVCAIAGRAQERQNSVEAYANAIQQSTVAGQIAAMEHYLTIAENGILKQDALEVLIWDYTRTGSAEHVKQRAQELLRLDANNPVAIAALEEQAARLSPSSQGKRELSAKAGKERVIRLKSALAALENMRKPEGMQPGDFAALRRHVEAKLEGTLGLVHVDHEEYQQAKTPLQEAVTSDPGNAQYAYALGLALLLAKEPDPARAYFYLARAANLAQGTPQGQQIAEFARKRYRKAGGSDADWNKFLAAAAVPQERQAQTATASSSAPVPGNPVVPGPTTSSAGATSIPSTPAQGAASTFSVPSAPAPALPTGTPGASGRAGTSPAATTNATAAPNVPPPLPSPSQMAALEPDVNRSPSKPPPAPVISSPNPPVSLAILIETALLTGRNRPMIFSALKEVVHHLRPGDEAALLVFSNQLDFEQDLTSNPELLTEAMESLRPKSGAALLEGVTFAAGHLKRIGKNATRVLLVISDGRSARLNPGSPPLSAQISGVRIDCIGLDVQDESGRNMLQNLAAGSGGRVMFVRGPEQFRMAAAQMMSGSGLVPQ